MPSNIPTWDKVVSKYFSQVEVGCMSDVPANPRLFLDDYDSIVAYIRASEENKNRLLSYLKSGHMPMGGPKWSTYRFNRFKSWVNAGCPKS